MSKLLKLITKLSNRLFGGISGNVFRGMASIAFGSMAARVVSLISMPLLTRLYSPSDFGLLAVFTAMISIVAPILTLRYVLAIPLPRLNGIAMNVFALSIFLLILGTIFLSSFLWYWGREILSLVSMEELAPWWWLISLGVFVSGIYEALSLWATRKRAYREIGRTQVTQSIAGSFVKIILGLLNLKPFGLLVGQVFNNGGGIGYLLAVFRKDFSQNWRHVKISIIKLVAFRYIGFPTFRLASQFLMLVCKQAPLLIAATLYGAEVTGQLGLALMALALPMNIIGTAIGKAFYGEIAALGPHQPNKIFRVSKNVQSRLFLASLPCAIILYLFGEAAFSIVFGDQWQQAGQFVSLLSLYITFQLTSAPLINVLNVYNKQNTFLLINIVRAALLIPLFIIAKLSSWPAEIFILIYGLLMVLFYLGITLWIMRFLRSKAKTSGIAES